MKTRSLIFVLITVVCNVVMANEDHPTNNLLRKMSAEIRKVQAEASLYELNLVSVEQFKRIVIEAFGDEAQNYPRLEFVMETDSFSAEIIEMYNNFFYYIPFAYMNKHHYQMAGQYSAHFVKGLEKYLHKEISSSVRNRLNHAVLKVLIPEYRIKACKTYLLN